MCRHCLDAIVRVEGREEACQGARVPPCWPMMSHECSGSMHAACILWQHHAAAAVSAVSAAAGGPGRRPRAAASGRGSVLRRATRSLAAPGHAHRAPCVHTTPQARVRRHWPTTRHAAMVHGVNDWSGKTMLCLMVRDQTSYRLITMCERIGNASAHGHGAITVQHPLEVRTSRDVRIRNGGCGLLQFLGILG